MRWNGIVSDSDANEREGNDHRGRKTGIEPGEWWQDESTTVGVDDGLQHGIHETASDSGCKPLQDGETGKICRGGVLQTSTPRTVGMHSPWENWGDEPNIPRVVDGIPNRVDRIKALGNAVVPQQFYIFFKLIADIENGHT